MLNAELCCTGGVYSGRQSKGISVDTLPDLWRKNENKGICRYGTCQISFVLPQVQKGNSGGCGTTENGNKQMSRTHKSAEPASRNQHREAGSFLFKLIVRFEYAVR